VVTVLATAAALLVLVMAASAALTRRLVRKAEREYPPAGAWLCVGGRRLHYLQSGRGRPIVLIHGLRGSAYDFEVTIAPGLARHHHVVAFDRPGNGYSDCLPPGRRSLLDEAAQLRAATRELGLRRPLLVGYSIGAAVALAWADAYPHEVAGVVTIAGHVMPCRPHVGLLAFFARRPLVAGLSSHTLLVPLGRIAGRRVLRSACLPQPLPGAYAEAALAMALRPATFRYAPGELCQAAHELRGLARRYGRLPVHVTVLAGAGDAVSSPNEARYFLRHVAHATLIMVPDGGHALHATHPELVVSAVRGAAAQAWPQAAASSVGARHLALVR
jgi:pimeloyl-ACP methyl ester carboxylesterase